jgi:hypothetical protein
MKPYVQELGVDSRVVRIPNLHNQRREISHFIDIRAF